jgi:hypothetical protein
LSPLAAEPITVASMSRAFADGGALKFEIARDWANGQDYGGTLAGGSSDLRKLRDLRFSRD